MASDEELMERLLLSLKGLAEFGEHLSSGEGLDRTSRMLLHHILGTLLVSKGAIFVYDPVTSLFKLLAGRGIAPELRISVSEEEARFLSAYNIPFRVDECPSSLSSLFEREKDSFEELKPHIIVSLIVRGELIGLLILGPKFMNGDYRESDYDLISVIAHHLALGLYNFRLVSELKDLNFELNKRVLELETLYDLGLAITSLRELSALEEEVLIRAVGLLDAKMGLLAIRENERYFVGAKFGIADLNEGEYLPEEGVLARVSASRSSVVISHKEEMPSWLPGKRALAIPVKARDKILGVIIVADKESRVLKKEVDFSPDDEHLLSSFASQAAIALENAELYKHSLEKERMEKELEMAAEIQRSILPEKPPLIPGLEMEAFNKPCRQVGGDYFDFIPLAEDKLAFVIADVSGKGMPAALLVSTLQAALRAQVGFISDISLLAEHLNKVIYESSTPEKFITFFFSVIEPSRKMLYSVNAGHCYPRIIRRDGKVEELRRGGFFLGIFPEVRYEMDEVELIPGDLLLLYSDGLTEATNEKEEEYGEERLISLVKRERDLPLAKLRERIIDDLLTFTGEKPFSDDLTLLLIRLKDNA